nr:MAG TPA: hypothetical protein [Caudoviricetes sp.]
MRCFVFVRTLRYECLIFALSFKTKRICTKQFHS